MDLTAPPSTRARLLAFDGGGIRGLFSLEVARRIEALLRERHGRPDLVLADHFHYLGGTSTGAIIATFLSWGLPVDDYLRESGTPSGWAWLPLLARGDMLVIAAIALLAGVSLPCLLVLTPVYFGRRDIAYLLITLALAAVLVLAASGVFGSH